MKIVVTQIQAVELPNYLETISAGNESVTVEAPLLGKFSVTVQANGSEEELLFEVREQPNGPLIDEYREDQIWEAAERIARLGGVEEVAKVFNPLMEKLSPLVFEAWRSEKRKYPLQIQLNT